MADESQMDDNHWNTLQELLNAVSSLPGVADKVDAFMRGAALKTPRPRSKLFIRSRFNGAWIMDAQNMMDRVNAESAALNKGRDTYQGEPKYFHHLGQKKEVAFPWLSDIEIAGAVRMLLRTDLMHEPVVCAARDRIMHLSEEVERLRRDLAEADRHAMEIERRWLRGDKVTLPPNSEQPE